MAEQTLLGLPPLGPRTCSLGDSGPRVLQGNFSLCSVGELCCTEDPGMQPVPGQHRWLSPSPQRDVSPVKAALGSTIQFNSTSDWAKGGPRTTASKQTLLFHRRGNLEQRRKALSMQSLNVQTHLGKFTIDELWAGI